MAACMNDRHLLGDRKEIAKSLRAQKIQNTKTNLVFGFDDGQLSYFKLYSSL